MLDAGALGRLPAVRAVEVMRLALEAGGVPLLRRPARRALMRLLEPGTRAARLRAGPVAVERSGQWIRVGASALAALEARPWRVPGTLALPEVGLRLEARCFDRPPDYDPPRSRGAAAFDADRLPERLLVRGRRAGDRLVPFGGAGERRLKRLLIDAGVPRWERDRIPLLEAQGDILWVAGVRRGPTPPSKIGGVRAACRGGVASREGEASMTIDGSTLHRPRPVVLVIDDEAGVRDALRAILQDDFEVLVAPAGAAGLELARTARVDVVLLDVRMPGEAGPQVLPRLLALDDALPVILITADPDVRTAVEAMKTGAYDYVTKPLDADQICALVRQAAQQRLLAHEVRYLRSELDRTHGFDTLVGRHPSMVRLYARIAQVAPTPATVLISGESGTGKELVARAIHRQSPRREGRLVCVNLAAIPDTLLESELFGHEKGAFTGAQARKLGKFELAHGGTLFLDEVGSLRIDLQAKLLRALQEREVERLGGIRTIPVDVRVIAATNVDLRQAVRARAFREDLFYRLNVVPIAVPPLRERKTDISLLVDHFVRKCAREFNKDVRGISRGALPVLEAYEWPGNVRELENIIERGVALATRPVIRLPDLPLDLAMQEAGPGADGEGPALTLREARGRFEQAYILRALEREDWNVTHAARRLGVHRNTVQGRVGALGLRGRRGPAAAPGPAPRGAAGSA
jgi:tRNA(Ile)-lysidine synthetase-like protein